MKRARLLDWGILFLLGAEVVSCKPKSSLEGAISVHVDSVDIPILKVAQGDFWRYEVRVEIPAGVTGRDAAAVDTTHIRTRTYIGRVPIAPGEPEVECFEVTTPGAPAMREFVQILEDRVDLLGNRLMSGSESVPIVFPKPVTLIRAGARAGDVIDLPRVKVGNEGGAIMNRCLVIGREEVEVPAGKYQAIRLLMNTEQGQLEIRRLMWFSPGTGIVREEKTSYAQGRVVVRETQQLTEEGHGKGN